MQTFLLIIGAIVLLYLVINFVLKSLGAKIQIDIKTSKKAVEKHNDSSQPETQNDNSSISASQHNNFTILKPQYNNFPRAETQSNNSLRPEIKYISNTMYGSQTCTESITGTSTSTISRTYGTMTMTDSGKVVTSMAEIAQLSAGDTIRFKAIISSQNTPQIHSLIAYICEEFQGLTGNSKPIWRTFADSLSPVWLELPDGEIQVINHDYDLTFKITEKVVNGVLQGRPMFVPDQNVFAWDEMTATGTKRYCGLAAGDEVVVTGAIVLTGDFYAVEAQHIKLSY